MYNSIHVSLWFYIYVAFVFDVISYILIKRILLPASSVLYYLKYCFVYAYNQDMRAFIIQLHSLGKINLDEIIRNMTW